MTEQNIILDRAVYVNKFTEDSVKLFHDSFYKFLEAEPKVIPVVIDSYGGYVDSLVAMIDIMRSTNIPVATICMGKAMSCGAILLGCGTKDYRYIAPNARVMIHHVSNFSWGKEPDLTVEAEETRRVQQKIFSLLDKNMGQKKGYTLEELKNRGNTDWYLSAEESKKIGLVDHIKLPIIKNKKKQCTEIILK